LLITEVFAFLSLGRLPPFSFAGEVDLVSYADGLALLEEEEPSPTEPELPNLMLI
jgi:hypothetical protein